MIHYDPSLPNFSSLVFSPVTFTMQQDEDKGGPGLNAKRMNFLRGVTPGTIPMLVGLSDEWSPHTDFLMNACLQICITYLR